MPEQQEKQRFYTTTEVAHILRISEPTVRKLIEQGDLSALRVGLRRQYRISQESLDRYLQSGQSHQ